MATLFRVLSFDPTRIKIASRNGLGVVEKKTTETEYIQFQQAIDHLKAHPINLAGDITVTPAPLIEWQPGEMVLVTQYCDGINLEQMLRVIQEQSERQKWIEMFRDLFLGFKKTGFLWGDCAPRNMIYDPESATIHIVDFERKLVLLDGPPSRDLFTRYVRNYSLEEFASFLLREEVRSLFDSILRHERQQKIQQSEIASTRKRVLLSTLLGENDTYWISDIVYVEELMASAATPFIVNSRFFFPMDIIDRISEREGVNAYVKLVSILVELSDTERYEFLTNEERSYA